jgi:cell division topological specificity factor
MGILDFLKRKPEATASVARERLRIIVAQERSTRGAPDYLPMMRNELLEVIKKYVHVDLDAININFERDSGHEILELSVTLPERSIRFRAGWRQVARPHSFTRSARAAHACTPTAILPPATRTAA